MPDMSERLDDVEKRLGGVESAVEGLKTEVEELREEVGELRDEVGGLRSDVDKLRIVVERHGDDTQRMAEVQIRHGEKLDVIAKALNPLAALGAFIKSVAGDHEHRIAALEKHTGIQH